MIEIRNLNNKVIHNGEFETVRELLEDGVERGISFKYANLRGFDLRGTDLRDVDLRGSDLGGADLRRADLRGSYFEGADLRGVNLRGTDLRGTDLRYADLRDANLRGTDLRGSDLEGADLRGTKISYLTGNNKEIKILQLGNYIVNFTNDTLAIGCEQHPIEDWKSFSDERIQEMDKGALEWWNTWKEIIFKHIELNNE